jgi:hypothetical protein
MRHYKLFVLLVIFLSSCAYSSDKRALNLYYEDSLINSSSLEILKKYGPAQQMWRDSFDNNVFSYSHSKPRYSLLSFFPIPVFQSKFDNYEVILTFNNKGNLIEVKKFYDRVQTQSWLVCESKKANCDLGREVVDRK